MPTLEDSPKHWTFSPKAQLSNVDQNLPNLSERGLAAFPFPWFVLPSDLQLTFRAVKVVPSDAALKATCVPLMRSSGTHVNIEVCLHLAPCALVRF